MNEPIDLTHTTFESPFVQTSLFRKQERDKIQNMAMLQFVQSVFRFDKILFRPTFDLRSPLSVVGRFHESLDRRHLSIYCSPDRSVLKIHFFIELGLNMIQFKTKSGLFIQKNIHSIESRIFNRIIHSQKMRKIIQNSKMRPKYGFGALLRPLNR